MHSVGNTNSLTDVYTDHLAVNPVSSPITLTEDVIYQRSQMEQAPATGHLLVDISLRSRGTYHTVPHVTLIV